MSRRDAARGDGLAQGGRTDPEVKGGHYRTIDRLPTASSFGMEQESVRSRDNRGRMISVRLQGR